MDGHPASRTSQAQRAETFRALHQGPGAFVIPNPWDIGSARLLAGMGFEALATTSAGYAFSRGVPDFEVGREQMLAHIRELSAATDLPLSADLENGYGHDPETVAETIRLAAEAGAVGGSIEDATQSPSPPLYPMGQAIERIHAAVEAARSLDFPFTLTARAEHFLVGRRDLDELITRLQAYQALGADVLYAPGLASAEEIGTVVAAVERPVNVVMGLQGPNLSMAELETLGVRRVSLGSSLARAAYGAFLRAIREVRGDGSCEFAASAVPYGEINELLANDQRERR